MGGGLCHFGRNKRFQAAFQIVKAGVVRRDINKKPYQRKRKIAWRFHWGRIPLFLVLPHLTG